MPSSCPIKYYKYHLFGSIVKMQKKQLYNYDQYDVRFTHLFIAMVSL